MLRVRVLSDVHTEFHGDGGRRFVESLRPDAADVVVLAGDIAIADGLLDALVTFGRHFPHVVFVPGNHEWYGGDRERMLLTRRQLSTLAPNVHWLEESTVTLLGQRFVGTSLWFPDSDDARKLRSAMSDFQAIIDYEQWVWSAFERARSFLAETLQTDDVVVSHHLPSVRSVARRFEDSRLNCYFVGDVEPLIVRHQPRLWIHGHTHESCDYRIGATRVLCNPFGYVRAELNPRFDRELVVAVGPRD
jgi:Icc-related predicted phosphoesterase